MKLLTATTRYYLLLAAGLFGVAGGLLYWGLSHALRTEVEEELRGRALRLEQLAAQNQLPPAFDYQEQSRSPRPRRLGLADTLLPELPAHEPVPYRQLTFRLPAGQGGPAQWVTLRKSLVEADDVLTVLLAVLLGVLAVLLLGTVLLNRWLAARLWAPFRHTLATLQAYDLHQHQPLRLPAPAIAEFAELNQAFNHLSERLVADYQTLRDFTAHAAHETQTPLAIMQAQLEQLLQLPTLADNEAALTRLSELLGTVRRLARLHQALTLLSKLENRQFAPTQLVPVHLDQLLRDRLETLAPLLEARQLHLSARIEPALPAQLLHPGLADSLLFNLLQNAVRHNHPGGQLAVALGPRQLTVRNTGPALAGDPTRFFERFHKQNAASESPGLGLSIVQHICAYYHWPVSYTFEPAGAWHTLQVDFA